VANLAMLDTMICIWAFKREATAGQEDKIRQARALISSLEDEGYEVGISAVTLSELMVSLSDETRVAFSQSIQNALCVYAFDVRASIEAARLFKTRFGSKAERSGGRKVVKADCQIAGTALASGATVLYTEDVQLQKILSPHLMTKAMPPIGQKEFDL
jgi:predicted nucleic acid-binding protein